MTKKKTKLSNVNLKSVDMVNQGANQEADICLFKSADGDPQSEAEPREETSILTNILNLLKNTFATGEEREEDMNIQKMQNDSDVYLEAFQESVDSIIGSNIIDDKTRKSLLAKSLRQFTETFERDIIGNAEKPPRFFADDDDDMEDDDLEDPVLEEKTKEKKAETSKSKSNTTCKKEGEKGMNIDKSKLSTEEQKQLDQLLAKAAPKGIPEEHPEDNGSGVEKSIPPELKAVLDRTEAVTKRLEMREFEEIAKKYAPLGEKPEELAKTLYEVKLASPDTYDKFIAQLDKSLEVVNKSSLFTEIGKSGAGSMGGSSPVEKIETAAAELRKSDAKLSYNESIAKAWENNPDLMEEYDNAYSKRG